MPSTTDPRQRWALILGASSGFGEATALALAADGYDICGVHLDRRQGQAHVDEIKSSITALGRQALFINGNAADDEQRAAVIVELRDAIGDGYVKVMLHSLAFGTLKPFLAEDPEAAINRRNLEMTLDVMANSLVYWTQDVWRAGFLADGSKIYALTSEGSTRAIASYGAVGAAKAALESHCRQLALELGPRGITANAICAGVTDTPSMNKIPNAENLQSVAIRKNPSHRLTRPEDVANALVALAQTCTYWLNGNILFVDGGEAHSG
jgi:NAD(P)-dependent dehydrogenase (short-subunit alcohol dehydrogenase family)